MGLAGSKAAVNLFEKISWPSYYKTGTIITDSNIIEVKNSWDIIMSGAPTNEFLEERSKDSRFSHSSCLTWFFEIFFEHFFELCPDVIPMFANVSLVSQGRVICGVISFALGTLNKNDLKLRRRLSILVEKHYFKGVRSQHYGFMGSALLYALEKVLGSSFDVDCNRSWTLVYSHLLGIILPMAMKLEQEGKAPIGPVGTIHSLGFLKFDDIPDQDELPPGLSTCCKYSSLGVEHRTSMESNASNESWKRNRSLATRTLSDSRTNSSIIPQSSASHMPSSIRRTASYHGITYEY